MGKKYDPINLLIKGQRFIEKISKPHPEKSIVERVKLRRQKAYGEDLSDMPLLEGDNSD